jgi:hypothetical protein
MLHASDLWCLYNSLQDTESELNEHTVSID